MVILIVIGAVIIFALSGTLAKTPSTPATVGASGKTAGVPGLPYNTPLPNISKSAAAANPVNANAPPTVFGTGPKPSGIVTNISNATGSVTFYCSNTSEARGIDISGAVIFDKTDCQDGSNSAVYLAGAILDHIDLMSAGGTIRLQVYFPTEDVAPASTGLIDETFAPVGQQANQDSSLLPYPAGDPNYSLPSPSPSGAFDPSNSWYTSESV